MKGVVKMGSGGAGGRAPGPWRFDGKFLNQQQFAGLWTASVPVYVGCEEKEGSRRPSSTGT